MKKKENKLWQKLPSGPGVYLFKDSSGSPFYIGKALNLKERVKNHFQGETIDYRGSNLLTQINKIDFIETKSEIESLLLEAKLIKQYLPKYNVRLKDDSRYLYVGITNDLYPRVILLRRPEKEKNLLDWFGPFPSAHSIREILRSIRRIFPYCSCRPGVKTPCLYYHLRLCPGVGIQPTGQYLKNIRKIRLFLNGNVSRLIKQLARQMKIDSKDLEFEEANLVKKQIELITSLLGRFKKMPEEEKFQNQLLLLRKIIVRHEGLDPMLIHRIEAYDISNLGKKITVGSMVVFIEGEPDNSLYRRFKVLGLSWDDPGAISQIIERRLKHKEWIYPQLILVDGGKTQVVAALRALKENNLLNKIAIVGLVKKEEKLIIPKISENKLVGWKAVSNDRLPMGILQHARDEAHRFARKYYLKRHQKITFPSSGLK